jgi:hypothetical protein
MRRTGSASAAARSASRPTASAQSMGTRGWCTRRSQAASCWRNRPVSAAPHGRVRSARTAWAARAGRTQCPLASSSLAYTLSSPVAVPRRTTKTLSARCPASTAASVVGRAAAQASWLSQAT